MSHVTFSIQNGVSLLNRGQIERQVRRVMRTHVVEGRIARGVHLGMQFVFEEKIGDKPAIYVLFFEVYVFDFGKVVRRRLNGFNGLLVGGDVCFERVVFSEHEFVVLKYIKI